jgi:hypothetical protein
MKLVEQREAQVHAKRKDEPRAGDFRDQEHQRRRDRKAPDDRHLRIDDSELEFQREPGRAPDQHGAGEQPEITGTECSALCCSPPPQLGCFRVARHNAEVGNTRLRSGRGWGRGSSAML